MGTADDTKRLRNTTMSSPPINSFVLPDWMVTDPNEIRRVEDVMKTFHHLASVNDTETLLAASEWLGADPSEWLQNGAEYMAEHEVSLDGLSLDYEQQLRDGLYQRPRQPKGDTRGRARVKSCVGYRQNVVI